MIKWEKKYNIGIKKIDKQHKKIVSILNELYFLEDDEKAINNIFLKLRAYIQEHFSLEEQYMIKCGYPGLEEQKEKHSQFIDKLCDFQKDFLKNKKIIKINLFNFVWDWFSVHILRADKKIGIFLKEQD